MCIVSDKRIEFAYLFGGIGNVGVPSERPRRKDGTEDGSDMMFFCQFAHRDDITHDMFNRNRSVVLGNVVDAAENDDRLRTEVDDILPEADEHFSRGLPAYTASEETV